jgi:RsiW-degrading membrane proteinase PrsW (M82 family)
MSVASAVDSFPARAGVRLYLLAVCFALAGGLFGILGAFVAEARTNVPLVAIFIGAPVVEEITKPMGIYVYLLRWRDVLRSQLHIALLVAISGLCFGLLESLVYVTLYVPDHSRAFFIYRFTVTVLLHGVASFIAGLGVSTRLIDWANGRAPFPRSARNAFAAAILLHALYNTTVVVLSFTGTLTFD